MKQNKNEIVELHKEKTLGVSGVLPIKRATRVIKDLYSKKWAHVTNLNTVIGYSCMWLLMLDQKHQ